MKKRVVRTVMFAIGLVTFTVDAWMDDEDPWGKNSYDDCMCKRSIGWVDDEI